MADVIGPERLPLAQRFRRPAASSVGEPGPHHVWYFATKGEFVDYLRDRQGPDIAESLGVYLPPKVARARRELPTSYFYKDLEGRLSVTVTLYHEVSHQLLFETAGPTGYERNAGNYWVFEGLGTYFETVTPQPDGSLEIGGWSVPGPTRPACAWSRGGSSCRSPGSWRWARDAFKGGDVYLHYAESMALTIFLMQADGRRHREGFLDYVRDAYRGRLRGTAALAGYLGERYEALDERFLEFLKAGRRDGGRNERPSEGGLASLRGPAERVERRGIEFAGRGGAGGRVAPSDSLPDVGEQGHEPGALDGVAGGSLEGGAVAAPFPREHLALVGAQLLQQADVLVVDVGRARAAFGGAEPATVLAVTAESFARHEPGVLGRDRGVGDGRAGAKPMGNPKLRESSGCRQVQPRPVARPSEAGPTGGDRLLRTGRGRQLTAEVGPPGLTPAGYEGGN
jgi:hypothetical protein